MKKLLLFLFHSFLLVFLTVITCTGGLAHLAWLLGRAKVKKGWRRTLAWPILYVCVWFLTGFTVELTGRTRLPINEQIKPASWFYVMTNRTFVLDHVNEDVKQMTEWLEQEGIEMYYLDSAFPYDVPLVPHWSHQSGACVDFAFVYEKGPRGLVYGDFEEAKEGEENRPELCLERNPLYSATQFLCPFTSHNSVDVIQTRKMILKVLNNPKVNKCFLEAHLVSRWKLNHRRMRFHGCHAVRHDDHLHVEWKH